MRKCVRHTTRFAAVRVLVGDLACAALQRFGGEVVTHALLKTLAVAALARAATTCFGRDPQGVRAGA